ncbi:MAG: hypothetical protein RRA94_00185 [Bacteroidota bacterium]|nr:hypothetical protein [Bacteroidota bacterium]
MKPRESVINWRRVLSALLLLVAVTGTSLQLHVGLADNGDYTRLMQWFSSGPSGFAENWPPEGSAAYDDRFYNNVPAFWKLDFPFASRWVSSVLLLWLPGLLLNVLLFSTDTLYLPLLSIAPRLFLLFFLWLLLRHFAREGGRAAPLLYAVVGIPLVFLSFNTDYVAYFTSFYQEPASLIGLCLILLAIGYYTGRGDSRGRPWLSAAAVLFMTTAKLSNIHWALLAMLLLVPWRLLWHRRRRLALYVLLIGILPTGFSLLQSSLYGTRTVNAYQSIYCGGLVFSSRPASHLQRLGMSDGLQYIGHHAYGPEGKEAMLRYPDRMSHRTVADILLHEPAITWRMLVFAADSMQRAELTHLSKTVLYNQSAAQRPWARWTPVAAAQASPLDGWSRLKRSVFPRGRALIAGTLLLLLVFLRARKSRNLLLRRFASVGVLLALGLLADMWMQIFGDGQRDLIKHLYLANICWDGMLIAGLGALAAMLKGSEEKNAADRGPRADRGSRDARRSRAGREPRTGHAPRRDRVQHG